MDYTPDMDEMLHIKDCLWEDCEGKVYVLKKSAPSLQALQDKKQYCSMRCGLRKALAVRAEKWKDPEHKAMMVEKLKAASSNPINRKKLIDGITGSNAPWWKDDEATYNSKHRWIQKHFVRSGKCDFCGITPPPRKGGTNGTEWSNISGQYNRNDRNDWQELCSKCHKFFDKAQRIALKRRII